MKKLAPYVLINVVLICGVSAQNYDPIINYYYNGTPTHGVKIKTNLPFTNSHHMPTLIIEGYNYGKRRTIGLTINWYVFENIFYASGMSSFGGAIPEVILANESGKVVLFINERDYFNRFTIRGFSDGRQDSSTHYQGWSVVDEALTGTHQKTIPYYNSFSGKVGIGTSTPDQALTVKGKIHSEEIIVDLNVPGPDYVFEAEYELASLAEIEAFINANKHLPEVPSAAQMEEEGIVLGEMNMLLLKKVEELTLHMIALKKENDLLKKEKEINITQQALIDQLINRIEELESKN